MAGRNTVDDNENEMFHPIPDYDAEVLQPSVGSFTNYYNPLREHYVPHYERHPKQGDSPRTGKGFIRATNTGDLQLKSHVEPVVRVYTTQSDELRESDIEISQDNESLYDDDLLQQNHSTTSSSSSLYDTDIENRRRASRTDDYDTSKQSRLISKTRPKTMSKLEYSVLSGMPSHQSDAGLIARSNSSHSSRRIRRGHTISGRADEPEGGGLNREIELLDDAEMKERIESIKQMPTTIWVKRLYRDRLHSARNRGDALDSITRATGLKIYGFKEKIQDRLEDIQIWARDFKIIEGHFGPAILSYFRFIRWILFLNVFITVVMFFVTTFPVILLWHRGSYAKYITTLNITGSHFAAQTIACTEEYVEALLLNRTRSSIDYLLEFLQGTGFMENTVLFYGHYSNLTFHQSGNPYVYNMSLAYLLAIGVCFFISFLLILRNSGESFKTSSSSLNDVVTLYTNKIFCGWDFCISNSKKCDLRHRNIYRELMADLDEQNREEEVRQRTVTTKMKLFSVRIAVNVVVFVCLAGSLGLIYIATDSSLNWLNCRVHKEEEIVNLIMQYLPSISITVLNVVVPLFFGIIVSLEQYSPSFEIYITLIRIVFLRLCSFAILIISLYYRLLTERYNQAVIHMHCEVPYGDRELYCGNYDFKNIPCWETYVGQQMYKLVLLDFIVVLLRTFFIEFPRRLLVRRFQSHWRPLRWLGMQQFDLPENVLDLVYSQTLCWFGTFFAPLLPVICSVKCFIIFYVKKTSLLRNCNPPERPYRASKSHSFFMLVLLISFIISTLGVGYVVGNNNPSQSCGPFRLYSSDSFVMIDAIWNLVNSFPKELRDVCNVIMSPSFVVPLMIILCYTIYINWAFAMANRKKAKMLQEHLSLIGRDKQFLLNRVHEAERKRHARHHRPD